MKYILICLLIFSIVGFRSERFYHFSLKETQAQFHWQNLENINDYVLEDFKISNYQHHDPIKYNMVA